MSNQDEAYKDSGIGEEMDDFSLDDLDQLLKDFSDDELFGDSGSNEPADEISFSEELEFPSKSVEADNTFGLLDFMGEEEKPEEPDKTVTEKAAETIAEEKTEPVVPEEATIQEEEASLMPEDLPETSAELDKAEKRAKVFDANKNSEEPEKKKKKEKKGSIFKKLFGNVPEKKKGKEGTNLLPEGHQEQESEEEKKKKKAEEKAAKKVAAKKKKDADQKKKAAEQKKKQADKKGKAAQKAAEKKEKKEKKAIALKEAQKVEQEPPGRINRVGATLVFSVFFIILVVIALGSRQFNYDVSIESAEREFDRKHYNEAYEEIRGVEVRKKDFELRDKVMTVMYVNKQLNSYQNFSGIGDQPHALDSLLKGLNRYEKYLALAKELGVEDDLDYVRTQILGELEKVYGLGERDAINLAKLVDKTEYSERVYEVASAAKEEEKDPAYLP